jgi:hypothetical protein
MEEEGRMLRGEGVGKGNRTAKTAKKGEIKIERLTK